MSAALADEAPAGAREATFKEACGRARQVDRELRRSRRTQRALDARIASLLAEMEREELWRALGHSSLTSYAREVLGYSSSKTSDLLRIGRRSDLPQLQEAFRGGQLS
ncbi:MAG TPA: hypothetical protein DEA08_37155 [Planctomycetes bacterium]|nr:hypothetical protein [Planctomycetota bacterium]